MKLIIVESPAKARTIEKFLGRGFKVAASYGHIRDLPSSAKEIPSRYKDKPWARLGVDTEGDFAPIYVVSSESKKHVAALRKLLKDAEELLLATDEDREGEAISWHLLEVLQPKIPVRRITFHEITRDAIAQALANPRDVNLRLVRAQESRRILDRLYGYSLSPVLWKKVRTKLSAGRVQSVAVRLTVEREEERQAFHRAVYWDVEASLQGGPLEFPARLVARDGVRLAGGKDFAAETGLLKESSGVVILTEEEALRLAASAARGPGWVVVRVDRKEATQRPSPPFTTSTLQQAASAKLGMTPKQTMAVAQRLYEGLDLGQGERAGLITYMRTDSFTLSEKALQEAAQVIRQQFGDDYSQGPRRYKTRSRTAQEAHEAIRPTDFSRTPDSVAGHLSRQELALYHLIWSRAIASQMTNALLDKSVVEFEVEREGRVYLFRANGSVVRFPGFMRVYGGVQKEVELPPLEKGQEVATPDTSEKAGGAGVLVTGCEARRHETSPPARYTEASLVRKLEEEGIGRPSTYAPIISTIQARDYVVKKGGALVPTYIGMAVVYVLRRHFPRYVDLAFTAQMEQDLDAIATGQVDGTDFLTSFYQGGNGGGDGLLAEIQTQLPNIEYPAIPVGAEPESDLPISVRIGRTYVYVQVGEGEGARRATLPVDLLIDELTTERALELIAARAKAQEPLGQDSENGLDVFALVGPYGPYVQLGEAGGDQKPKRVSLPKGKRLEDVDLAFALRLLSLPRQLGIDPETGQAVTAGIGRFGPFVERARVYASLKQEDEVWTVTLADAIERINAKNKKTVVKELGHHPDSGADLQVIQGRYGPYVTDGAVNARLSRGTEPQALTVEEAVVLLAEVAQKKTATKKGRKTAKKSTGGKKSAKKTTKKSTKKTAKKAVKKISKKINKKTNKKTNQASSRQSTQNSPRKATRKSATKSSGKPSPKNASEPGG